MPRRGTGWPSINQPVSLSRGTDSPMVTPSGFQTRTISPPSWSTTRPAPPTWRRLAGATGLFAPIVRRRESRSASQIVLASCAAASAAVTPD